MTTETLPHFSANDISADQEDYILIKGKWPTGVFRTRTLDDSHLLLFGENIRSFICSSAHERETLRPILELALAHAPHSSRYLRMALDDFVNSNRPGRLDDAVDILSVIDEQVLSSFIWQILDLRHYSDDHLYCLIMALSKNEGSILRSMFPNLLASPRRGVREAVVEALGQWGDEESRETLEFIVNNDESAFIRELAADLLRDLGE